MCKLGLCFIDAKPRNIVIVHGVGQPSPSTRRQGFTQDKLKAGSVTNARSSGKNAMKQKNSKV